MMRYVTWRVSRSCVALACLAHPIRAARPSPLHLSLLARSTTTVTSAHRTHSLTFNMNSVKEEKDDDEEEVKEVHRVKVSRDVIHIDDDDEDADGLVKPSAPVAVQRKRPLEGFEDRRVKREQPLTKMEGKEDAMSDEQLAYELQMQEVKRQRVDASSSSSSTSAPRVSPTEQPYHDIAFYRNYIRGVNNDYAIKLEDVIQGDITRAVLLNYCWDLPWMVDTFPALRRIPRVDCVAGAKFRGTPELKHQAAEVALPNIHCHFAELPVPFSCHHTKMLLLFYPHGIRVVVMTANFLACDLHYKNQGLYVQDFPVKAAKEAGRGGGEKGDWLSDDFERTLCEYFAQYRKVGLDVVEEVKRFDYSGAKVVLIPSGPGTCSGKEMSRWGHMKVRFVLQREAMSKEMERRPITAQFSSFGSVQQKWLVELRRSLSSTQSFSASSDPPSIRLVWPTVKDVKESLEGWIAGGSICCDTKNHKPFLRPLYHRWDGRATGRHRAAPHIKSYSRSSHQSASFVLLTSANMSGAAWGSLQKNDSQLAIRHYEMGVLVVPSLVQRRRGQVEFCCTPHHPVYRHSDQRRRVGEEEQSRRAVQLWLPVMRSGEETKEQASVTGVDDPPVYRVVCPLPYSVDSQQYEAGDEPWAWDRPHEGEDWRGQVCVPNS